MEVNDKRRDFTSETPTQAGALTSAGAREVTTGPGPGAREPGSPDKVLILDNEVHRQAYQTIAGFSPMGEVDESAPKGKELAELKVGYKITDGRIMLAFSRGINVLTLDRNGALSLANTLRTLAKDLPFHVERESGQKTPV